MFHFQPKSTSIAVIEKAVNDAEEQENISNTAVKDDSTEEEWVEQKIKLKKLPRQYMQLSKIRLTGILREYFTLKKSYFCSQVQVERVEVITNCCNS